MNASFYGRLKGWAALLGVLACAGLARGAEGAYAWQDQGQYRPPDFQETFPDDLEAGKRLENALGDLERAGKVEGDVFELFRQGLRGLRVDRQMPALRWFGNQFIWGKTPQDPKAIDLMYHAAGSTNSEISYNAVHFGLSTVRPLTEPILRAFVDIGMNSEDPNVLSRIAWGAAAQKDELLRLLAPQLEAPDLDRRRHAEVLRKIFSGELKAFAWAAAKAKDAAFEKYSGQLEEIRAGLEKSDSAKRRETLELIQRENIASIMDDSFISAFASAAEDADAKVRKAATINAGSRWIWNSTNQSAKAIELMMRQSRDSDREVRYNAMYYGLSTIRNRSDEVVARMIEMLMQDGLDNLDFRRRVTWGLKNEKATVARVLEKSMRETDLIRALCAYGFYLDYFGQQPEGVSAVAEILQKPDETVGQLLAFGPTAGWRPKSSDEFWELLRSELPEAQREWVHWTNMDGPPFAILEDRDAAEIKTALLKSPRFTVMMERPMTVAMLVQIGKEGSFRSLTR